MIAQGGDPEAMSITQFLDLALAVCVDERVRRGMTLWEALEDLKEFAAGSGGVKVAAGATAGGSRSSERVQGVGGPGQPVTAEELQNAQSMAWLTGRMAETQGVA